MRGFSEKIYKAHEMDVDTFNSLDTIYRNEMKHCDKKLYFWEDCSTEVHHSYSGPIY